MVFQNWILDNLMEHFDKDSLMHSNQRVNLSSTLFTFEEMSSWFDWKAFSENAFTHLLYVAIQWHSVNAIHLHSWWISGDLKIELLLLMANLQPNDSIHKVYNFLSSLNFSSRKIFLLKNWPEGAKGRSSRGFISLPEPCPRLQTAFT